MNVHTKEDRDKFYNSKLWRDKRKEILKRDNYECQECLRHNLLTTQYDSMLIVDHIKELKDYPMLALEDSNLQTLCFACHEEKHDRLNIQSTISKRDSEWLDEWY